MTLLHMRNQAHVSEESSFSIKILSISMSHLCVLKEASRLQSKEVDAR